MPIVFVCFGSVSLSRRRRSTLSYNRNLTLTSGPYMNGEIPGLSGAVSSRSLVCLARGPHKRPDPVGQVKSQTGRSHNFCTQLNQALSGGNHMASGGHAVQTAGEGYSIWRVIMASAVGTMIEWYDFYIFGSL